MDSYVQMSLSTSEATPSYDRRIFGVGWSWLQATTFEELLAVHQPNNAEGASVAGAPVSASASLDEVLARYAALGASSTTDDPDNVRFRSTIEFPAFLLHVLEVLDGDDEEREGHLDDKRLIERFGSRRWRDGAAWVRRFALGLLRCRNLFDGFILKRQYTATNGDDGDWSLQRLLRRSSQGRVTPGYVNTFSVGAVGVEEDGDVDPMTNDVLVLQSLLRVTYTSPRTMQWITKVLRLLAHNDPGTLSGAELSKLLRAYARGKVEEAFFLNQEPTGFGIGRIVFTYLDYLLLARQRASEFRFAFRNSIEHFLPAAGARRAASRSSGVGRLPQPPRQSRPRECRCELEVQQQSAERQG